MERRRRRGVSCRRETFCWEPGYFEARKTREQGRGGGHISGRGDPRGLIVGYRRAKRGGCRLLVGGGAWSQGCARGTLEVWQLSPAGWSRGVVRAALASRTAAS
ncbi:hypothetical protein K491DRAFT_28899 [Lophiostoma macrostomum CBS 122681]|uniref:Uncharacterized protein n=1 Tax=Lophiostoma macrostomum CBS 122681 TaxID=1314788 RepID=A0A6A6T1Z4_9PLEO|nr:hypothetical protein K491DRAFT_28899 [Lophiostoma macrostomum CBS 122681]